MEKWAFSQKVIKQKRDVENKDKRFKVFNFLWWGGKIFQKKVPSNLVDY